MRLDLVPIFQNEQGIKNYLVTNFRRVAELFDGLKKQPALPDTAGATLVQLEGEVNALKDRLRKFGAMDS